MLRRLLIFPAVLLLSCSSDRIVSTTPVGKLSDNDLGSLFSSPKDSTETLPEHLFEPVNPPEHMANAWWKWPNETKLRELNIDFTIYNDIDLSGENGIYLMLCDGYISDVGFYFGLQTDVDDPNKNEGRGKGLIFSRWDTRDLAKARIADETEGWTQSSGHEGDFIGVRRSYDWGKGSYRVRFASDGKEADGEWFGVWITDKSSDLTTWIGSLKFPYLNGETALSPTTYTTVEIYGSAPIKPIDIPQWHVSVEKRLDGGISPIAALSDYSPFTQKIFNSDVQYDPIDGAMHFRVGGLTERQEPARIFEFPCP